MWKTTGLWDNKMLEKRIAKKLSKIDRETLKELRDSVYKLIEATEYNDSVTLEQMRVLLSFEINLYADVKTK